MIDNLSMYIAIKVFAVVKKNSLGLNVNVSRLMLKYFSFIVIICLMFIVYKLFSFFDISIVDGSIIILDDTLLKTTFLNDLLFYFMIFAVFSSVITVTTIKTTARTTKIHIILLCADINTFPTSHVVDANLLNNPASAMSIVGKTREEKKEKTKEKRKKKQIDKQKETTIKEKQY